MALRKITSVSISDIEAQIARITAKLEKARALEFATVEKAFLAAQKRVGTAQAKVNDLSTKGGTTAAAQSRLALAKAALVEQQTLFADVETIFNAAKAEQDAADEFARNVALVLSGKKLGKKIKLSKKEKAVLKDDKKAVKKLAKKEKRAAKKAAKDEKKNTSQNPEETTQPVITAPEKSALSKKAVPTKKLPIKKAPVKKEIPATPDVASRDEPVPALTPVETPISALADTLPPEISAETTATEEGHDSVVESETLPKSEEQIAEDHSKPVDDQ